MEEKKGMGSKEPKKTTNKKRKKGKPSSDPNKMSNVDRTFYELTITDLNNKISRLRSTLASLENANFILNEKVCAYEDNNVDIIKHLERTLDQRNEKIAELESVILELRKARACEQSTAAQTIQDLQTKFRNMKAQLTSEIKLLSGKLRSLDEFRRLRSILYEKLDDQRTEGTKRDRDHADQIYEIQQKVVVERDNMRKEIEEKLLEISHDFTLSNEIRQATHNRRLFRENIALRKEVENLVASHIKMRQQVTKHVENNKELTEQYTALKQLQGQLLHSGQNKMSIIAKLTEKYEHLKCKYVEVLKYRTLYENPAKRDQCVPVMSAKLIELGKMLELLKLEKNNLLSMNEKHQSEIERLHGIIQQIKNVIKVAIEANDDEKKCCNLTDLTNEKRYNLLTELVRVIRSSHYIPQKTPSVRSISYSETSLYQTGIVGLVPFPRGSLIEIFKNAGHLKKTTESEGLNFDVKTEERKIIPKDRTCEAGSIIDVEWGSALYMSSTPDDRDIQLVDDFEDTRDENSTSSYQSTRQEDNKHLSTASTINNTNRASSCSENTTNDNSAVTSSLVTSTKHGDSVSSYGYEDADAFSINLFY